MGGGVNVPAVLHPKNFRTARGHADDSPTPKYSARFLYDPAKLPISPTAHTFCDPKFTAGLLSDA
jgi:hypothetical protein